MAKKKESLMTAVSEEIKSNFNLDKFKEKKLLNSTVKFKEQKWIPFSKALQDSVSIPGAPVGHITLLRGHSNTGKTTALLELAINAQKMGILPVFIITEMKWSWEHAKQMGFQVEDVVDETTGDNFAGPGSLFVDITGANLYIQTSAITTPVWKQKVILKMLMLEQI